MVVSLDAAILFYFTRCTVSIEYALEVYMQIKKIENPGLAFQHCKKIASEIDELVLRKVALQILNENQDAFLSVKGSDWQHHNYAGGLIVHTCNVTLNAIMIAEFYKEKVSTDLVKFCALMHDVGKFFDYKKQDTFSCENEVSMNRALLGHGFEGACYVANKLKCAYSSENLSVPEDYVHNVIVQVSHCIGAHMDCFGACAPQQMFEVLIIGCADKVDAYLDQTIIAENEDSFTVGTGDVFYKAVVDDSKVMPLGDNPLQVEHSVYSHAIDSEISC